LTRYVEKGGQILRATTCSSSGPGNFTRPSGHTIIREVLSADRGFVAAISRDERGVFRVHCHRWCTEDWEFAGSAVWVGSDVGTLVDTFVAAQKIAEDEIAVYEGRKLTGAG
jgi:hypothetical protein